MSGRRVVVAGHDVRELADGWSAVATAPDACLAPGGLDELVGWSPAPVPGTAAAVLAAAGRWRPGEPSRLDDQDWWFRTRLVAEVPAPDEEVVLVLDGIATIAEVWLDDERILESDSMFAAHRIDVTGRVGGDQQLAIRCRALTPLLAGRRRPRARWRTRLVAEPNLRFVRTSLLGRAPGFAPGPAPVGPWRPVRLERRRAVAVDDVALRPLVVGARGELAVRVTLRGLGATAPAAVEAILDGPSGVHRVALTLTADPAGRGIVVVATGGLNVPDVARWWPHTHGEPVLHDVHLAVTLAGGTVVGVDAGRVGFRSLTAGPQGGALRDVLVGGPDLHVNGVPIFARGAVWTTADPVGLAPDRVRLRAALLRVRDAGMNLLRIPGTGAYESTDFWELCDELGLLVWQDAMFANLDYPTADPDFAAVVEAEARAVLAGIAGRPSLAVVCGNSEIEQQVAMLGLDPALGRGDWFGAGLPALVATSGADAVYVPSAPCGGPLPFRPDRGVANYYGVGGYRRPLEDARRARVRFAAECLAFANVPDDDALAALAPDDPSAVVAGHPRWKAGVPRDVGAGWDFEDVRDHYLALLFGVDPALLRATDHDRYLELSRAVSGEVMAETFGEWRRAGSPCRGALVLWLADRAPGAGWGVLDHRGEPKVAYHHLRRALAPVAVWTTDEGLGGVAVHVANDRPAPLAARLRVALYRDGEQRVEEASEAVEVAARGGAERDVEAMVGRFVDAAYAYRFGPPGHDVVVASLERDDPAGGVEVLSQAFRFPAGRPLAPEPAQRLGLAGTATPAPDGDGDVVLSVTSRRVAYGVRVSAPGFEPDDDAFSVEPGGARSIRLRARAPDAAFAGGALTALNLRGRVRV